LRFGGGDFLRGDGEKRDGQRGLSGFLKKSATVFNVFQHIVSLLITATPKTKAI